MNTIIFILWLIHNPGIGGKEDDLAVEAFPTLQACEDERKSGEFAERFRCRPLAEKRRTQRCYFLDWPPASRTMRGAITTKWNWAQSNAGGIRTARRRC